MIVTTQNYTKSKVVITEKVNSETLLTVPDQGISIAELLANHTRGIQTPYPHRTPIWDGDEELPNIEKMDFVEIDELRESIKDEIKVKSKDYEELRKNELPKKYQKEKNEGVELLKNISDNISKLTPKSEGQS